MFLSNFVIRRYLNFIIYLSILMMLNKIVIQWFSFNVTTRSYLLYLQNYASTIFNGPLLKVFFTLLKWTFCHDKVTLFIESLFDAMIRKYFGKSSTNLKWGCSFALLTIKNFWQCIPTTPPRTTSALWAFNKCSPPTPKSN